PLPRRYRRFVDPLTALLGPRALLQRRVFVVPLIHLWLGREGFLLFEGLVVQALNLLPLCPCLQALSISVPAHGRAWVEVSENPSSLPIVKRQNIDSGHVLAHHVGPGSHYVHSY